ncbi:MAG TPA: hypothetical protein VNQ73_00235 [Ilumatobacter sp.]|nr:hypothetical protein [Ilumatobacter sp.]
MADVTCPECGTVTELPAIRRAADEFCRHCDYPLFWTPSAAPMTSPGGNAATALRRLPGAGGRQRIGSKDCPACGELNPLGATDCLRCGANLDPKPPEPVVEELPPPAPEPEPEPVKRTPWWWWLVLAGVVTAAVVAAVVIA